MSEIPTPTLPTTSHPKKNKYGWIIVFVLIFVASVTVASIMIWYNLSIQLTPEQLQAAKERWKATNLRDYKLVYSKRLNDNAQGDRFVVTVRAGKVEEVLLNGKPLGMEGDNDPRPYHTMDRLFHDVERFMQLDQMPNKPKVFVTAIFDEKTGAIRRYIRRVMGSHERIELLAAIENLEK